MAANFIATGRDFYRHRELGKKPIIPNRAFIVMMTRDLVFELMFCRFEGTMWFHCNREVTKQMTKMALLARNRLMNRFAPHLWF